MNSTVIVHIECIVMLGLTLSIAACNLSQPYPAKQLYAIDAGRPESPAPGSPGPALRVQPVRVARPFSAQMFYYRVGPSRFEPDYYANFADEPSRLITAELIDWLTATRQYEAVVDASSTVKADRSLQLIISELYLDASDPVRRQAVVAARVFLIDEKEVEARVLLSRDYRETEDLSGDGGDALATAWGKALGRMFERMTDDLSAAP